MEGMSRLSEELPINIAQIEKINTYIKSLLSKSYVGDYNRRFKRVMDSAELWKTYEINNGSQNIMFMKISLREFYRKKYAVRLHLPSKRNQFENRRQHILSSENVLVYNDTNQCLVYIFSNSWKESTTKLFIQHPMKEEKSDEVQYICYSQPLEEYILNEEMLLRFEANQRM